MPDGLIYYGRTGMFGVSKSCLGYVTGIENILLVYPQKEQYVRFKNNEWGKTLQDYVKIV